MKKTLFVILIFIGIVFISLWVYEKRNEKRLIYYRNKDWTINFPKKTEYVKDMPKKENLWVFLMAGQSNMAGRAFVEPSDTISNKRILTIDKNDKWIYAKEPLHFYEPTMAGLDCGLSFSHKILDSIPEKNINSYNPLCCWRKLNRAVVERQEIQRCETIIEF